MKIFLTSYFQVKFIDQQTPSFVKTKRQCEFWIRGTNKGVLESPMHSLPANTTCLYHLQGIDTSVSASPVPFRPLPNRYPDWRHVGMILPPPRYRVWLSIVKFHVAGMKKSDKPDPEICRSYLNVWDGQLWVPTNCDDLYWWVLLDDDVDLGLKWIFFRHYWFFYPADISHFIIKFWNKIKKSAIWYFLFIQGVSSVTWCLITLDLCYLWIVYQRGLIESH